MVGDNIKRIRISLGMTQEELAVKTGYTRAGISRIENNERDIATPKVKIFADAGIDAKIVQDRLGHANIRTTLNIYTHVSDNMKQSAVDVFEKIGGREIKKPWRLTKAFFILKSYR